jgi:hypothetical protein
MFYDFNKITGRGAAVDGIGSLTGGMSNCADLEHIHEFI